jgi:glutaredoxin-related protein
MFPDGSYCEEWAFMNGECEPGDIMYNVVSEEEFIDDVEQKADWNGTSEIYSDEDLQAAVDTIMNTVDNEWQVKVEMQEIFYQ